MIGDIFPTSTYKFPKRTPIKTKRDFCQEVPATRYTYICMPMWAITTTLLRKDGNFVMVRLGSVCLETKDIRKSLWTSDLPFVLAGWRLNGIPGQCEQHTPPPVGLPIVVSLFSSPLSFSTLDNATGFIYRKTGVFGDNISVISWNHGHIEFIRL